MIDRAAFAHDNLPAPVVRRGPRPAVADVGPGGRIGKVTAEDVSPLPATCQDTAR
jgi:hypothetical protein